MNNSYLPHHLRREHNEVILGGELVQDEIKVALPTLENPKPQEKPLMEKIDKLLLDIENFPTKNPYKDKTRKTFVSKEGEKVMSMIFGKVRAYDKKELVNSSITNSGKYAELEKCLRDLMKLHNPNFRYTTIQTNKSLETPWHYDKGNVGMSYLIAFGKFKGGGTVVKVRNNGDAFKYLGKIVKVSNRVENVKIDNKHSWLFFDGHNSYHKSAKSTGIRFAVVYYTKS